MGLTMYSVRSWRWRVLYADGSTRDVLAASKAGALRTGRRAALIVGCKEPAAKPASVTLMWEVGSNARPDLFPPDETPDAYLEAKPCREPN